MRPKIVLLNEKNLTEIPAAEMLVNHQDQIRQDFLQSIYGSHWHSASAFDLVIDTGKIYPQTAVVILLDSVKSLGDKKFSTQAHTRELPIDPVIAQTIKDILSQEPVS